MQAMSEKKKNEGKKTIQIDEEIHTKAKTIAATTKLQLSQVIELLISNHSEEDIRKLAKKEGLI